jgi:hypothetical protein
MKAPSNFNAFMANQVREHGLLPGAAVSRVGSAKFSSPSMSSVLVTEPQAVSFAAPAGYTAEPSSLEVHRQALKLQHEQHGRMSYMDAVRELSDPAKRSVREKLQGLAEEVPLPRGYKAPAASLDLHRAAVKLQRANPDLSYIEAVRQAGA